METPPEKTEKEGVGPFVGIIIVVILIALGGIYFLIQQQMKLQAPPVNENQAQS